MPLIIPAILAKTFSEVERKINQVEPYSQWVHLDIIDGKFAPVTTWQDPRDLKKIKTFLNLEVHLMVEQPSQILNDWLPVVQRILIHLETVSEAQLIQLIDQIHSFKKEIGLVLKLETPVGLVKPWINKIDLLMFLGVEPGYGGQKFSEKIVEKIKNLPDEFRNIKISVDGGLHLADKSFQKVVQAGVDILVLGTEIFQSQDIGQKIKQLNKIAQNYV